MNLLGIEKPQKQSLPFRHRFLVENKLVDNDEETLASLDRKKIDNMLYKWNEERFIEGKALEELHFCSED